MIVKCQAIRGAITVKDNNEHMILEATEALLKKTIELNNIKEDQIISIFFTATTDLNAAFPAKAARNLGLLQTPLMCGQELEVPGALAKCIRLIMHVNTDLPKEKLFHVYEREANVLRPDKLKQ